MPSCRTTVPNETDLFHRAARQPKMKPINSIVPHDTQQPTPMDATIKPLIFILCLITCSLLPLYYIAFKIFDHTGVVFSELLANGLFTLLATGLNASSVFLFIKTVINKHYPWQRKNTRRVVIELISTNAISITGSSLFFGLFLMFSNDEVTHFSDLSQLLSNWFNISVISMIINSLSVSVYEAQVLLRGWMRTKVEAEQLRREKAESQYAALKNQVNPHFLFNSLNSLSSLIRVSPDKAIEFVDKFSKIYRYVLDVSDQLVVPIEQELQFLQSFYFLQTIRFGDNLRIVTRVDASHLQKYIMPLSLQILIENAIKHNEISSENPLTIHVCTDDCYLMVTNHLQPKTTLEHSNGIGLKNIAERYKHFTDIETHFGIINHTWVAKIPMLEE